MARPSARCVSLSHAQHNLAIGIVARNIFVGPELKYVGRVMGQGHTVRDNTLSVARDRDVPAGEPGDWFFDQSGI